jgi:hypothetical protein
MKLEMRPCWARSCHDEDSTLPMSEISRPTRTQSSNTCGRIGSSIRCPTSVQTTSPNSAHSLVGTHADYSDVVLDIAATVVEAINGGTIRSNLFGIKLQLYSQHRTMRRHHYVGFSEIEC